MASVLDFQLSQGAGVASAPQDDGQAASHDQAPHYANLTNGAGTLVLAVGGLFVFIWGLEFVERKLD